MNNSRKPQAEAEVPHMEKSIMQEPMEEFVADQSVPSKSMQAHRAGESTSPQRTYEEKSAGQSEKEAEVIEPPVEG